MITGPEPKSQNLCSVPYYFLKIKLFSTTKTGKQFYDCIQEVNNIMALNNNLSLQKGTRQKGVFPKSDYYLRLRIQRRNKMSKKGKTSKVKRKGRGKRSENKRNGWVSKLGNCIYKYIQPSVLTGSTSTDSTVIN